MDRGYLDEVGIDFTIAQFIALAEVTGRARARWRVIGEEMAADAAHLV
jgi:hypothetical protein